MRHSVHRDSTSHREQKLLKFIFLFRRTTSETVGRSRSVRSQACLFPLLQFGVDTFSSSLTSGFARPGRCWDAALSPNDLRNAFGRRRLLAILIGGAFGGPHVVHETVARMFTQCHRIGLRLGDVANETLQAPSLINDFCGVRRFSGGTNTSRAGFVDSAFWQMFINIVDTVESDFAHTQQLESSVASKHPLLPGSCAFYPLLERSSRTRGSRASIDETTCSGLSTRSRRITHDSFRCINIYIHMCACVFSKLTHHVRRLLLCNYANYVIIITYIYEG